MKSYGILGVYPFIYICPEMVPNSWICIIFSVQTLPIQYWCSVETCTYSDNKIQGWYQTMQHLLNSHEEREYKNKYTKGTATEMVNIVFSMPHPNQK